MSTLAYGSAPVRPRATAFMAIIALHGLVIYGLISGTRHPSRPPPGPVLTRVEVKPDPIRKLEPVAPVQGLTHFLTPANPDTLQVPDNLRHLSFVVPEPITALRGTDGGHGSSTVPATPLRYLATRSPDDYYLAQSIRFSEQGIATVRVCVAANGQLAGTPRVEDGSGFPRLDAAAVKWASEALRFTAATYGDEAISACLAFRVRFRLKDLN